MPSDAMHKAELFRQTRVEMFKFQRSHGSLHSLWLVQSTKLCMVDLAISSIELHSERDISVMARPGVAGFGQMLARPLFRERHHPDMSEEDAVKLMHEGLRVCHIDA